MSFIKRKMWIFLSAMSVVIFAIANDPKDPLLDAVKALNVQTDAVLRSIRYSDNPADQYLNGRAAGTINNFLNDHMVDLKSPEYRKLIQSFAATKAILEKGSEERQNEKKLGQGKLAYAAEASKRYLDLERRLIFNLLRNTHGLHKGSRSDLDEITSLNLHLSSGTALTLLMDDQKYMSRFSLWHVQSPSGDFEKVEYGVGAQELADLETQALQEVPSEERYKKLLQLSIVRERMTNRWAISRLIGAQFDNSAFNACAMDLYSFSSKTNDTAYQALWQADRADELNAVKTQLASVIENLPIVSKEDVKELLLDFYSNWDSTHVKELVQRQQLGATQPKDEFEAFLAEQDKKSIQSFSDTAEKAITAIEKEVSEVPKGEKNKRSFVAVADANFPADRWDVQSVSARVAWAAYHLREKLLVDLLVNKAKQSGVPEVLKDQDRARDLAYELVRKKMELNHVTGGGAVYRFKVQSYVSAAMGSTEASKAVGVTRAERMKGMEKRVYPVLERVAQADYVKNNISELLKNREFINSITSDLSNMLYLANGSVDYNLGYVPAVPLVKDRVRLYTADQLSLFFVKKMKYWRSMGDKTLWIFSKKTKDAEDIGKVLDQVSEHPIVMRGVHQFFAELNKAYTASITERKLTPSDITPSNTPLADLLFPVAQLSYLKFAASLTNPQAQEGQQSNFLPKVEDQRHALNLYVHAMSLLNIAGKMDEYEYIQEQQNVSAILNVHKELAFMMPAQATSSGKKLVKGKRTFLPNGFNIAVPFYRVKSAKRVSDRVHSPLDMELVLNETNVQKNALDQVAHSLLDQKLAADVIKDALMDESPILAIHDRNQLENPRLADRAVQYYHVSSGLDKTLMQKPLVQAIYTAGANTKSLVEEACDAKPKLDNEAFKRIFSSAKNLRAEIIRQDRRFGTYDEALRLEYRSPWETFKDDYLDRACMIIMWATLIALSIYFAPIVYTGLSSVLASGSWMTFGMAAKGAYEATLAAGGYQALISTVFMSKAASSLTALIFLVQAVVWTHVNCYELPAQLQYQLQVAQSQIGVFKKGEISNSEIERFNEEIHAKKVSTYVLVGFQAIFIPGIVRGVVATAGVSTKGATTLLGTTTKGALNTIAEGSPEAKVLVEKITQPSLTEAIAEDGFYAGSKKYFGQKFQSIGAVGRATTLGTGASREAIQELQAESFSTTFESDPGAIVEGIDQRLERLTEVGNQLIEEADKTLLIAKSPPGAIEGSAGFVKFSNTEFTLSERVINWIRNQGVRGLKNTNYWDIAVVNHGSEFPMIGNALPKTASEMRAAVLYAMAKDLQSEGAVLLKMRGTVNYYLGLTGQTPKQNLANMFKTFSPQDWFYLEKVMNYSIKEAGLGVAVRFNLCFSAQAKQMQSIYSNFKNMNAVHREWKQITDYFYGNWGKDIVETVRNAENEAAARAAEENNIVDVQAEEVDIVNEEGVLVQKGLPAEGQSYSEFIINLSDLGEGAPAGAGAH